MRAAHTRAPTPHQERHAVGRVGWLRAGVLGANDGLLSTASLLVGVAAADVSRSRAAHHRHRRARGRRRVDGRRGVQLGQLPARRRAGRPVARSRRSWPPAPARELAELQGIYIRRGLDPALAQAGGRAAHGPRRAGVARPRRAGPRPDRPGPAGAGGRDVGAQLLHRRAGAAARAWSLAGRSAADPGVRRRHAGRPRRARCRRRRARRRVVGEARGGCSSAAPSPWPSRSCWATRRRRALTHVPDSARSVVQSRRRRAVPAWRRRAMSPTKARSVWCDREADALVQRQRRRCCRRRRRASRSPMPLPARWSSPASVSAVPRPCPWKSGSTAIT